ncbi:aldo/keto reductase [Sphingomonas sp. SUN019]|uniref:aldo/keto reductase n=1 Tax=Sphingomonas sp. SUN019 TaxID=2937788 RepID=UPI002164D362|nr:aldo/keto reductase [Sphingomonas sp. SUN019]UVO52295.1 aldo/keto reductase [Sphingomonas sp. SUN019]
MLYSKLGTSGLIVSRLSLGTMTFGAGSGNAAIARTREADAAAIVDRALDAGINFIDTADVYAGGESEEIVGRILGKRRDDVVLATKAGWRTGAPLNRSGLSAAHLHWSIDQSLKRLGTTHVDVYIAHRDDAHTPLEETLQSLDAIVRAGKARYLGVSNWSAWKVAAAMELQRANGWAPFTHIQMMYSLLGRGVEHEVLRLAAHYGLGYTAWSPLAGGFLSGKYTRENLADPDNRLSGFDMIPFDKDMGFVLVETMREIAAAHDASVAQVALAWLLSKPQVSSVLIGASKLSQLDDNIAAANLVLTTDELATLDKATAPAADFVSGVTLVPDGPIVAALAARLGENPNLKEAAVV